MSSALHRKLARAILAVALPALVGQGVLAHLHALDEGGNAHRGAIVAGAGAVLASAAAEAGAAHHRGECLLCVAGAQPRLVDLDAVRLLPTPPGVDDDVWARAEPPSVRRSWRTASLRGPPASC